MTAQRQAIWDDACLAAALFAVDPVGCGGVALRACPGPVRDRWLDELKALLDAQAPVRRMPLRIPDSRLLGGLDLAATLSAGRPIAERGLLADADGGVVLLAMAERIDAYTAARVAAVVDRGAVQIERDGFASTCATRFGMVALDEGIGEDEHPPASLTDRLGFRLDLTEVPVREAVASGRARAQVAAARDRLSAVTADDDTLRALCLAAEALGVDSPRAVLFALRTARACAALDGRDRVDEDDAATAAMLVLAPRATRLPEVPAEEPQAEAADDSAADAPEPPDPSPEDALQAQEPPPPDEDSDDTCDDEPPADLPSLDDVVLEAARAAIPAGLLERLRAANASQSRHAAAGHRGALQLNLARGRPAGVRPGDPRAGARIDVIETLRAAAPWQRLRRGERAAGAGRRVEIRRQDCRVKRFKQRRETTTIFVVDASGSSAYRRLAEAKGAVELLLAECYVRRDRVALIAFRGREADLLLPPTRSLVRAKRSLANLPGGGGTPLALALDAAAELADAIGRKGGTPGIVLLTDGHANIARDGNAGRERAFEDALDSARRFVSSGFASIVVDTSPLPQRRAAEIAAAMSAKYLALPYADASLLSRALRANASAREAA